MDEQAVKAVEERAVEAVDNEADVMNVYPAVARRLQVSRGHAYQLAREGVFPTIRLGRRVVVPRAAFDRWLDSAGTSWRTP